MSIDYRAHPHTGPNETARNRLYLAPTPNTPTTSDDPLTYYKVKYNTARICVGALVLVTATILMLELLADTSDRTWNSGLALMVVTGVAIIYASLLRDRMVVLRRDEERYAELARLAREARAAARDAVTAQERTEERFAEVTAEHEQLRQLLTALQDGPERTATQIAAHLVTDLTERRNAR
ncbi:hypothetical protein ACQEU3_47275 [Spirillospora sp. CA-253888]